MVTSTVLDTPSPVATTWATVGCGTAFTGIVNEWLVAPAGTVIEIGAEIRVLFSTSVTTRPPAGAAPARTTCACTVGPPLCGCTVNALSTGASSVNDAVAVALPDNEDAVSVAVTDCVQAVQVN